MTDNSVLSLDQLYVKFPVAGKTIPALGPLSLQIDSGNFVSIIGPSGCGKSTLLRVIAGLLSPTSGEARFKGETIHQPSPAINILFQNANLLPWRNVLGNIALPLELAGCSREHRLATAERLLPVLGLDGFAEAFPNQLSGGMAQRVALGRVWVTQPSVMLLDEPFGALDALTRERLGFDLLKLWREAKQTVILVTHDIQEAILLADRVLVLSERPGQLIADIPVPIERPRDLPHCYEREFLDCAREIRATIEYKTGAKHALSD